MPPAALRPTPGPGTPAAGPSPESIPRRAGARQALWLALVGVVLLAFALFTRDGEPSWYPQDGWAERTRLSVSEQQVQESLRDFPVRVDLARLSGTFWEHVSAGCGDIRMTTSDGQTEVPRQIVACDTASRTGTLLFLAPSLSSRTDTRFYLYFGNPDEPDYGADHPQGAAALASFAMDAPKGGDGGDGPGDARGGALEARP